MEFESPAPYIALGVIEKGEHPSEEVEKTINTKTQVCQTLICIIEFIIMFAALYISFVLIYHPPSMQLNLTVVHEYKQPEWAKTPYPDPDYSMGVWEDDFDIEDYLHKNDLESLIAAQTDESMYMTEYEEYKEYGDRDERITDIMFRLCSNIFPLEWPEEYKGDPQLGTQTMREDLEFCGMVFGEYADNEH